ncbi:phosphoenolpyruvate carboxylase, partial [Bacteroidota bacterium]
ETGSPVANDRFEPFKQYIRLLIRKLPAEKASGAKTILYDTDASYRNSEELELDLRILKRALVKCGIYSLSAYDVQKVLRHLRVFGFHLARLDVRQNSSYYEKSLLDIIKTSLPSKHKKLSENRQELEQFIQKELD